MGQLCISGNDRSTRRLSGVATEDEKITHSVCPNSGLNNKTYSDSLRCNLEMWCLKEKSVEGALASKVQNFHQARAREGM